jgi:hypothetical protein
MAVAVVKHLTDQAKIEGLSPLAATGTRRYKMATNKSPLKDLPAVALWLNICLITISSMFQVMPLQLAPEG